MGYRDQIFATISHIHDAGLGPEKWPEALSCVTALIGGHGASLEFMERPSLRHCGMYSHGLPDVGAYMEYYAPKSPRYPHLSRQPSGSVQYDTLYYDEDAMNTHPFYMEFLAEFDMRYFLGGVVAKSPHDLAAFAVQISPKQGHPSAAKIKTMALLLPHIQQATDVMRRLGNLSIAPTTLESTLDWLIDGVLMLAVDGSICYANVAAQAIFRANDGIGVRRGAVQVASDDARTKLAAAIRAAALLRDSQVTDAMQSDFLAQRPSAAPAYGVSVRPLLAEFGKRPMAVALVFIHDPLMRRKTSTEKLSHIFGLTTSEADIATALCLGLSPNEYALQHNVSRNTVYTHIRNLKVKTDSRRMAELIKKLNDVNLSIIAKREDTQGRSLAGITSRHPSPYTVSRKRTEGGH
jgi:DNA-binding CsgD family transcriptional regulator